MSRRSSDRRRVDARRYRRLIRLLFSAEVVSRHGDEMESTFLRMLDIERQRRGAWGGLAAWAGAMADGIRSGRFARHAASENHLENGRLAFGRRTFAVSWLDAKLGVRMLGKHPALTVVALFALAVGIPVGVAPWHLFRAMEAPLPVDDGARVHLLRHWNVETYRPGITTFYDLERWRGGLATFDELGGFRGGMFNVGVGEASGAPVRGAEVTASTFAILRVPPLHGRGLSSSDEIVGAPNVVVVSYDLWQARLGGDPGIVGRTIRLAATAHTVVGVMPPGFRFPIAEQLWLPLRDRPAGEPFAGRALGIFGRLADTATPASADAELSALGSSMASENPGAYARLRAEVVPFALVAFGFPKGGALASPEFFLGQFFTLLLLGVACANVAMLMFARTATRSDEFAVRTALGASRIRVVAQMFTESLVLAALAAGLGLFAMDALLGRLLDVVVGELPYWVDMRLTWSTGAWALSLAVLSAAIAGVVPAIRVTGRNPQRHMQRTSGRLGGVRFGGVSGALIVADVAVSVAVVGLAVILSGFVKDAWMTEDAAGIAADEFLAAELRLSSPDLSGRDGNDGVDAEAFRARVATTMRELQRRIAAEPGVRSVTVAGALPRMDHRIRHVELEGEELVGDADPYRVRTVQVDVDFFRALGQPLLTGRNFDSRDLEEGRLTVIVNANFVANVLGGREPIGRRFRYRVLEGQPTDTWFEIVGVVGQLGMHVLAPDQDEGIYHPAAPGEIHPAQLAVHLSGDPTSFASRLRELAAEVDPLAVVGTPVVLAEVFEGDWYFMAAIAGGVMAFVAILLALAASGLYAIMSLSVAERTREIGIRAALGASRGDIVKVVARRAIVQLAVGVAVGMPIAGYLFSVEYPGSPLGVMVAALAPGLGVLLAVGVVACGAPTLRALRIMPTEALR